MKSRKSGRNFSKMTFILAALILSVAALGMGTFAWYTLSTNPEISGINATVNTDRALLVSTDNENYSYSEPLGLGSYLPLVPVSTTDGLNWFVCKYDIKGDVLQSQVTKETDDGTETESQFLYLRFPEGGNINETTGTNDSETQVKAGTNGLGSGDYSYYVYKDIYLKTEEDSADVYLSLPLASKYQQDDTEQNHYGTYVLSYSIGEEDETETTESSGETESTGETESSRKNKVVLESELAETCVRVGFLVIGEADENDNFGEPENERVTSNGTDDYQFYIYEPNADVRSYAQKEEASYKTDKYIAGFTVSDSKVTETTTGENSESNELYYSETDGYYYQTYPVGINAATKALLTSKLQNATEAKKNNAILTWEDTVDEDKKLVPTEWPSDSHKETAAGALVDGVETIFPASHLMVQGQSTWKTEESLSENDKALITNKTFNSTLLSKNGKFLPGVKEKKEDTVTVSGLYTKTALAKDNTDYAITKLTDSNLSEARASVKITTLTKDKPQKIRIYFWIEGQDVDCWNDVSHSDFLVNLEFVGDVD